MLRTTYLSFIVGVFLAPVVLSRSTAVADDGRFEAPEPTGARSEVALSYEEYLEIYGVDLNKDAQVDEADYRLWQENPFIGVANDEIPEEEPFSYEEYLEIYGIDLNEDGQVDEADYKLWQENPFIGIASDEASEEDSFSYEQYLAIYGIDLDEDGQVDEADYRLWQENPFIGIPVSTAVSSQSWGAIKNAASR